MNESRSQILDLRADFHALYEYVAQRTRDFRPDAANVLGGPREVRLIQVGFDFAYGGWAVLVFDTRPDADSDGEWTMKIEGNELPMQHWKELAWMNSDHPITLVQPDGSESALPPEGDFATLIGKLLKAVLVTARANGVFASLPCAPGCRLGVVEFNMEYLWPEAGDDFEMSRVQGGKVE